jgi:hypothetical protein
VEEFSPALYYYAEAYKYYVIKLDKLFAGLRVGKYVNGAEELYNASTG